MATDEMGFLGIWQRLQAEQQAEGGLTSGAIASFLKLGIADCDRELNDLAEQPLDGEEVTGAMVRQMVRLAVEKRELERLLRRAENEQV